jgi:hypothetical protein
MCHKVIPRPTALRAVGKKLETCNADWLTNKGSGGMKKVICSKISKYQKCVLLNYLIISCTKSQFVY